jgi:hypothetical protein
MEKTHQNLQENKHILVTFLQILIPFLDNSASIHAVCKNISGATRYAGNSKVSSVSCQWMITIPQRGGFWV